MSRADRRAAGLAELTSAPASAREAKSCPSCKQTLPFSAFNRSKQTPTGLSTWCRECSREKKRASYHRNPARSLAYARAYYQKNRESLIAKTKEWQQAHPYTRDQLNAWQRAWRAANPRPKNPKVKMSHEEHLRRGREYGTKIRARPETKARQAAYSRLERSIQYRRNLKAIKKGAGGLGLTADEWQAIVSDAPFCVYCGADTPLQQEHVIALTRGGQNTIDNVVPSCAPCNQAKGARPLILFLLRRHMRPV